MKRAVVSVLVLASRPVQLNAQDTRNTGERPGPVEDMQHEPTPPSSS